MFKEIGKKEALELLKDKAKTLGINFNPSIGYTKLEERINDFEMDNSKEVIEEIDESYKAYIIKASKAAKAIKSTSAKATLRKGMTQQELKVSIMKEANRLVRCSITCLDPSKKDIPGQVFGIRNGKIPLIKKFVPYDGRTTHLPNIFINHLKEKEFQYFRLVLNKDTGDKERKSFIGKMFSVSILSDMTEEELETLAEAQLAAGTIS